MAFRDFLQDENDQQALLPYFQAVRSYVGLQPNIAKFYKYTEDEWGRTFGNDHEMLLGRTAAVFDKDRVLHVRQSRSGKFDKDGTLLHEMVHAAGLDKFQMVSRDINEGVTQLVTEEIGKLAKIRVAPTYHDDVIKVKTYILPLMGMDLRKFAQGYARAQDPAFYIAGTVWSRYWFAFRDTSDWGDLEKTRDNILKYLKSDPFSPWPYFEYLVDEVVGQKPLSA